MEYEQIRKEIVATALALRAQRVLPGTLGNISVRIDEDDVLITPSSREYSTMQPEDLPVVDLDGELRKGAHAPSVEAKMHTAIYRAREDVKAIIHTHAAAATALACLGRPLPCVVDELAYFAEGPVMVGQYAPVGTDELAANALEALGARNAVLLASHGLVAVGACLREARCVAEVVEHAADVYLKILGRGGRT